MYKRILVPVDGSGCSRKALAEAIALARLTLGRIRLIHVVDEPMLAIGLDGGACTGDLIEAFREAGRRVLDEATQAVKFSVVPVDDKLLDTFDGRLCELVVKESQEWPADLIVIGTHGRRGVGRLLLGSDAEQILRLASVPVLLVRSAEVAA